MKAFPRNTDQPVCEKVLGDAWAYDIATRPTWKSWTRVPADQMARIITSILDQPLDVLEQARQEIATVRRAAEAARAVAE